MSEKSLPLIGVVHAIERGVRIWHPVFNTLQVSNLSTGNTVITYADSDKGSVLFELTPEQREEFKRLLDAPPVASAQAATETVAQGVAGWRIQ